MSRPRGRGSKGGRRPHRAAALSSSSPSPARAVLLRVAARASPPDSPASAWQPFSDAPRWEQKETAPSFGAATPSEDRGGRLLVARERWQAPGARSLSTGGRLEPARVLPVGPLEPSSSSIAACWRVALPRPRLKSSAGHSSCTRRLVSIASRSPALTRTTPSSAAPLILT